MGTAILLFVFLFQNGDIKGTSSLYLGNQAQCEAVAENLKKLVKDVRFLCIDRLTGSVTEDGE